MTKPHRAFSPLLTVPCRRLSLLLLFAFPLGLWAADAVSNFEAMRLAQFQNINRSMDAMPALGGKADHALAEILSIEMTHGNLVVRTPLESTRVPGFAKAVVPGFDRPITVRVVGGVGAGKAEPVVPAEMLVQMADYSKPQLITTLSISQTAGANLSFVSSQTTPEMARGVRFIVLPRPSAPGSGAILIVTESGPVTPDVNSAPRIPVNRRVEAADCMTFVRQHPREVDLYVRPLLAKFGAEAVVAPDLVLCQQVLPGNKIPDPALRQRIEELLPALDAGDYHLRDQASAKLESIGKDAINVVIAMDRAKLSPEQNLRVDRALSPLGLISGAESARLRADPDFLLECLYSDDGPTRRSALAQIKELTGRTVDLANDAGPAARAEAVARLRDLIGKK